MNENQWNNAISNRSYSTKALAPRFESKSFVVNGMFYWKDNLWKDASSSIERIWGADSSFCSSRLDLSSIDPESCRNKVLHTLEDELLRDDTLE